MVHMKEAMLRGLPHHINMHLLDAKKGVDTSYTALFYAASCAVGATKPGQHLHIAHFALRSHRLSDT